MVITSKGDDRFEIKTKNSVISTGEPISINGIELTGPGEYEIGDCRVLGFPPSVYLIESEDLHVAYLDRIDKVLSDQEVEQLQEPDILFVPTGGAGTLDLKSAERLVALIDPKLVIPMLGDTDGFVKLTGGSGERVDQLKVTSQSLPEDGRRVVVFKP